MNNKNTAQNKYGVYSKTSQGRVRLCATTDAVDAVDAGLKLQKWADAMLGANTWWVAKIK